MGMEIGIPGTPAASAAPGTTGTMGATGPRAAQGASARLDAAVYAAAGLSLAAALGHLWETPGHFVLWWGYGAFFLTVALALGLFGVALLRWPGPRLYLAGIWANLAVLLVYLASRTWRVPFGPHAGTLEETGLVDMAAAVSGLAVVVVLATMLGGASRRRTMNALLLVGTAVWILRFAGVLS